MTRRGWFALLASPPLRAAWPQFLGPARNGEYTGPAISLAHPRQLWKIEAGAGFSSPVIEGNRLILFHRVANQERVECLESGTGKRIWQSAYDTSYRDDFGFDEGPRGTPAIRDGSVYSYGAEGVLHAWELAGGKKLWRVDTMEKFKVPKGFFGAAASPLVDERAVYLNVGGTGGAGIAAFDRHNGNVLWTATNDEAGYSSPVFADLEGQRTLLCFTRAGLEALDPANGKPRFVFPWRSRSHASVNVALPVVSGNLIFLTASYGTGAVLLKVQGGRPEKVWASDEAMSSHYSTPVLKAGTLYGFHGRQEFGQTFRAVDLRSAKVLWEAEGFGAGTVTLVPGGLLLVREDGEGVLAAASVKAFQVESRARLLPGVIRSYPAVSEGKIYVRNGNTLAASRAAAGA